LNYLSFAFLSFRNPQEFPKLFETSRAGNVARRSSLLWVAGVSAPFEQESDGVGMSFGGGKVQRSVLKVRDMIDIDIVV